MNTIIGLGGIAGISSLDLLVACTSTIESGNVGIFTTTQLKSLTAAIDLIIPETNSASASQAGVSAFIDVALSECFEDEKINLFMDGLDKLSEGKEFHQISFEEQTGMLQNLEENQDKFFQFLKQLTLTGYFTSEKGIKENFDYQPVPGKYQGCIPFTSSSKPWRGNRL